jgi:hypothetical protein
VNAFSYFSLAPYAPIRDNPALTDNGGSWADNSRRAARNDRGKLERSGAGNNPEAEERM